MKKLSKNITYWLGVITVGLIVGLSIQFVRAWTEPGAAPPGGNVGAPINTSNTGQSKQGNLLLNSSGSWANGLIVANGSVGIGTTSPGQKLDVAGYVKGRSGLCIGDDCRSSWPSGGGATGALTAGSRITLSPNPWNPSSGNATISASGGTSLNFSNCAWEWSGWLGNTQVGHAQVICSGNKVAKGVDIEGANISGGFFKRTGVYCCDASW